MICLLINFFALFSLWTSGQCEPTLFHSEPILPSFGQFESVPANTEKVECVEFKSLDGIYAPETTAKPSATACGLYLVGEIDSRVMVEFIEFDVGCANGHLVGVLDGWEQRGSVFPPAADLSREAAINRQSTYCGTKRPRKPFFSSGNFALIQYKLGQLDNFIIRVTFLDNPTPCNAVALGDEGQFELRNVVRRSNCSVMIIHPQQIQVSFMSVGMKKLNHGFALPRQNNAPFLHKPISISAGSCETETNSIDFGEIRGGVNWSVPEMYSYGPLCGLHEMMDAQNIFCETTVVRLVSSGEYDNIIVIQHGKVQESAETASRFCPALLL